MVDQIHLFAVVVDQRYLRWLIDQIHLFAVVVAQRHLRLKGFQRGYLIVQKHSAEVAVVAAAAVAVGLLWIVLVLKDSLLIQRLDFVQT